MSKTEQPKIKPWTEQGISKSKYYRDRRMAKAKRSKKRKAIALMTVLPKLATQVEREAAMKRRVRAIQADRAVMKFEETNADKPTMSESDAREMAANLVRETLARQFVEMYDANIQWHQGANWVVTKVMAKALRDTLVKANA